MYRRDAATAPEQAGLLELGARVRFRHPLVRSAAYTSASLQERQEVHRALAAVTDPRDRPRPPRLAPSPGRRRARRGRRRGARPLRGRAQARGGLAAAAAFLERSAELTREPARRGERLLAAARAKRDTGAFDAALGLLVALEAEQLDAYSAAEAEHLRGQIALEQQRGGDAVPLLLSAAGRLAPLDVRVARETHLEALVAAMWADDLDTPGGLLAAAEAARDAPAGPEPRPRGGRAARRARDPVDEGYETAAPVLTRALELLLGQDIGSDEVGRSLWLAASRSTQAIAVELWDADAVHTLATRQLEVAREAGALVQLRLALNFLGGTPGSVRGAGEGGAPLRRGSPGRRGDRQPAGDLQRVDARGLARPGGEGDRAARGHTARGEARAGWAGSSAPTTTSSGALQRPRPIRRGTRCRVASIRARSVGLGPLVVPELAEAASRTGDARTPDGRARLADRAG